LGLFVLLPQRCLSPVLVLVGELCMDVVALFIKQGESLFREIHKNSFLQQFILP
jgi:hypothetical protein